ncbi:phosphate acetyltransferase [Vibrio lamellibrachiae]|uniref:phosphate acetyltransferase n=1 Tax=Vibrio lamellibrachiae TaxID=2910253 RepID=UPI003D0E6BC6
MKAINQIIEKAKAAPARIVLCEAHDIRILTAAVKAAKHNIASIILVGNIPQISDLAAQHALDITCIQLIDPDKSELTPIFAKAFYELRKHKGISLESATKAVAEPLCFTNMMVREGYADGCVAGAVHTTSDVVRNSIQILGVDPNYKLVSSFFLMMMCEPFHTLKGGLIFSDCGLVIDPSAEELADIALSASQSAKALLMQDPKVAMLSFSTNGSAKHKSVDKVVEASRLVKQQAPDLAIDDDIQLDAAIVADIANSKLPNSKVKGESNVLVFPNLEAGNIGYKLAQRLGGALAIGPLLQGLAKPANDLSRGCSADDAYHVIAVTVVQAQALSN